MTHCLIRGKQYWQHYQQTTQFLRESHEPITDVKVMQWKKIFHQNWEQHGPCAQLLIPVPELWIRSRFFNWQGANFADVGHRECLGGFQREKRARQVRYRSLTPHHVRMRILSLGVSLAIKNVRMRILSQSHHAWWGTLILWKKRYSQCPLALNLIYKSLTPSMYEWEYYHNPTMLLLLQHAHCSSSGHLCLMMDFDSLQN